MKPTKLSILNFQGSRKRAQRKFTYWLCSECSRSSTTFFRPCRGGAAGNIFSPPCNFRGFSASYRQNNEQNKTK